MSTVSDIITKIERDLPGFAWKVGTCCVSDDAWLVPDFNHPVRGPMLRRLFKADAIKAGSIWDLGIDIDLRPSGRPSVALQMAYDAAIAQMKADGIWDDFRAEVDA
jgi:hypothetical protein